MKSNKKTGIVVGVFVVTVGFITVGVIREKNQQHALEVKHQEQVAAIARKRAENDRATMKDIKLIKPIIDPYTIPTQGNFEVDFTVRNTGNKARTLNENDFVLVSDDGTDILQPKMWVPGPNSTNPWGKSHTFKAGANQRIGMYFPLAQSASEYQFKFNHGGYQYGVRDISLKLNIDCTYAGEAQIQQAQAQYQSEHEMSYANFEKIDSSYTVSMVNDLFGMDGTMSSEAGQGTNYDLQTWSWVNSDATKIVTIEFQNGHEDAKDEIGLQ